MLRFNVEKGHLLITIYLLHVAIVYSQQIITKLIAAFAHFIFIFVIFSSFYRKKVLNHLLSVLRSYKNKMHLFVECFTPSYILRIYDTMKVLCVQEVVTHFMQ